MQSMVDRIRRCEKSGDEDVMVAGDPEKKTYKQRIINGIPIDDDKFNEFMTISKKIGKALINK